MDLQHLWHFVWALQAEEWPLEKPTREQAFTEVANFAPVLGVKFDREELKDPAEFLPKVAAALYRLLAKPPAQPPSIPPNLQDFVKIHQDHLAKKTALKAGEPVVEFSVDDWIRQLQETVNKKTLTETQKTTKETIEKEVVQAGEIFRQHVTSALSQEIPAELTPPEKIRPISQKISQVIEAVLSDLTILEEEREAKLTAAVNSTLKNQPIPEEQKARAQSAILEQTKEARETLREQKRLLRQKLQAVLVESKPAAEELRLLASPPAVIRQQLNKAIRKELTTIYPSLSQNPTFLDELVEAVIVQLPEEALTNPPRLLELLKPALPKALNQAGIMPDEKTAETLSRNATLDQLVASDQLTIEQSRAYKEEEIMPIMGGETATIAARPGVEPTIIGDSWSEMDHYEMEPGELNKVLSVIRHPQTLPAYAKEKAVDLFFFILPIKTGLFNRISSLTGIEDYNIIELSWKFRLTAKQLQQQIDWLEGRRVILGLVPNLRPIKPDTKEYVQIEELKGHHARLAALEAKLTKAGIAGRIFSWRMTFVKTQEKLQTGLYYYQLSTSPLGPRIFTEMVAKKAAKRWILHPLYEKTLGRTFKWLRLKTGLWEEVYTSILTGKKVIGFTAHKRLWEKIKEKFKESRIGKWIETKIIARIPGVGTIKKVWSWIWRGLLGLAGVFAAYLITYGIPAAAGFLGGVAAGLWPSLKIAGAVAALPIPGARIISVPVFFASELLFGIFGARIGIWLKTNWTALATKFSTLKAQVGAGISSFIHSLGSALPEITLPTLGTAGAVVGLGAVYTINYIIGGAFQLTTLPTQAGSLYIQAEKTATPSKIENHELAQEPRITYQISFWPTTDKLTNITVTNETKIRRADGSITAITEDENGRPLGPWTFEELSPGNKLQIQYIVKLDSRYPNLENSRIVDTITITADVPDEEKTGETQTAIAAVTIGQPPMTEPEGWPASGCITQGPNSSGTHQGVQAIDIANGGGNSAFATHDGTAYGWEIGDPGYPFSHNNYGNFVKIVSPDGSFETYYAHLEDGGVFIDSSGQGIIAGTPVGIVGDTGRSTGPHLHYELRGDPGRGSQINNYLPFAIPSIVLSYCETNNPNFITVISQYE